MEILPALLNPFSHRSMSAVDASDGDYSSDPEAHSRVNLTKHESFNEPRQKRTLLKYSSRKSSYPFLGGGAARSWLGISSKPKTTASADATYQRQGSTVSRTSTTVNRSLEKSRQAKQSRSEANIPEAISPHGTLKGNQPLKGIGKLFGVTRKQDQLTELLQSYNQHGLPPMPELLQLGHRKFNPAVFKLESSWTEIVTDTQSCNRYQQEAIWELLKTEVAYIRDLQLVINLFLACLYNLQSQALLNEVETEKIFSNIADLHQHNCLFFETHMYPIIETARETGQPLDPTPLIQGFTEFRSFFEAYSRFCIDYMGCQQYLLRMKEDNELFKTFLNWAENQRDCNRLSLRDYIGKPFQRLTKYKLLLERIWREPRPDHVHAMISKVDLFICQVNATVTQLEIMRRIDSYDAVDLPNNDALAKMVGQFCRLDLTRPIHGTNRTRYLLEEGTLRMNSRTDVICFLFTDMLLITKATSKKVDVGSKVRVKVYRPPMRLDKVYVSPLQDGGFMLVYLNEYNLATTAYTFHGDGSRMWYEKLKQAQDEYEKIRSAIMDQSEAYLLNLANGHEYDDEYAYMNARSVAMEMGREYSSVHRQASVTSTDTMMERLEARRTRSMTSSDSDKSRLKTALSLPSPRHGSGDTSPRDSPPATPLVTHTPGSSRFQSPQDQVTLTPDPALGSSPIQSYQQYHPMDRKLPNSANQDELRKLKQRRDRRYYTADMIQELHTKPSSIQKWLSWHSGAKDTDYEVKPSMVRGKTVSSDSIRSQYSSSGVSSVGSLTQNPDNEISEECDWMEPSSEDSSSLASDTTTKTKLTINDKNEAQTRIELTVTEAEEVKNARNTNLTSQGTVSKSMPDISQLTLTDDVGVSRQRSSTSLDHAHESQRRKLTDSHSRRLKLQILNSTLEATDV